MRASRLDKQWIFNDNGALMGLRLGADYCAEHEQGVAEFGHKFGLSIPEYPIGIQDRAITTCSEQLVMLEYSHQTRDKRRKAYSAACLLLPEYDDKLTGNPQGRLCTLDVGFYTDFNDTEPGCEQADVQCAWGKRGFAIHVRGSENIARLRTLHAAFVAKDLAFGMPTSQGFLRNGLSFVICSAVPQPIADTVMEHDLAHQRLGLAVEASGIHATLKGAGKEWYSLKPDWYDRTIESGLLFFLNPCEQKAYRHGWFTLNELVAWSQNRGPVQQDEQLKSFDRANVDWSIRLIRGLAQTGLGLRVGPCLVWMDQAKTQIGVRVLPAVGSEAGLPAGIYEFHTLMERYPDTKAASVSA